MESNTRRKLRVLVADDQAALRELLTEFLQEEGHEIDQAVDGADAWAKLQDQTYDYVVMDLHMPELNGLDVLRLMRKLTPRPRTILVTGAKTGYVEQMALVLGAAGCYQKPLSFDSILRDMIWAPRISARPNASQPSAA